MVFSAPAKVASGVAVTSASAVGTFLTYKYVTGLYVIEKYALDNNSKWKIKESDGVVTITSKALDNETLQSVHGVSKDGIWTCNLKTQANKDTDLKNKLKEYFGVDSISSTETEITSMSLESRTSFLNSCSKYRTKGSQTNEKVVSEIIVDSTKFDSELEAIFEKFLNTVEKKVYLGTNLTFAANTFAVDTANKKVTGTITVSNASGTSTLGTGETWTCTLEGTPTTGIDLTTVNDVSDLSTTLTSKLSSSTDKKGLVNSCARNRTSKFSENTVQSTLKLSVSKKSSTENKLKFDDKDLDKVFKGAWVNLA